MGLGGRGAGRGEETVRADFGQSNFANPFLANPFLANPFLCCVVLCCVVVGVGVGWCWCGCQCCVLSDVCFLLVCCVVLLCVVVLIPLNFMVRGRDRPPHVLRGDPTGKLQRPVQLHKRGSRTNEDATPVPCAASSEAAPTWHRPRQATARMTWSLVTNGPPPPEPEPPRPCWLHEFRVCCFFPPASPFECHTIPVSSSPLRLAVTLNCRHQSGVHNKLHVKEWQTVGHNLQTSVVVGIRDSQVHVSHEEVCCHAPLPLCTLQCAFQREAPSPHS